MTIANPHRGEVEIKLLRKDGSAEELVLRPTFAVITELEGRLGLGFIGVLDKFASNRWGLIDVAAIVAAGLRGSGHPAQYEAIGERVMITALHGQIQDLAAGCAKFLNSMWHGAQEDAEEDPTTASTGNGSSAKKASTPSGSSSGSPPSH